MESVLADAREARLEMADENQHRGCTTKVKICK
jgi:hypothetical protein